MRSYWRAHAEAVLSPAVIVWRAAHGLIATGFLAAIGYVWWCALTGRRGRLLRPVIAVLAGEGVLVVANRGDCPLGGLGDRIGDPVPLFELVLSPRAARRAVPALGALTAVGVGVLATVPNWSGSSIGCREQLATNGLRLLALSSEAGAGPPVGADRSAADRVAQRTLAS